MSNAAQPHMSVMLPEVLEALSPVDGGLYVDGTLGAGGYTEGILRTADCHVVGIDRDETVFDLVKDRLADKADHVQFIHGRFGDVRDLLTKAGIDQIDGIVVDLGVSSMQLDQAERGFSFRFDGPLDMRMDQGSDELSAADVVNEMEQDALADVIYLYGDERKSRQIARAIVEYRRDKKIKTTFELADIVRSVVPKSYKDKIDPATRTFQALRIYVNKEMDQLHELLDAAQYLLKPGGRLVVVSFHSLEDGIAKRFLLEKSGQKARGSRHLPDVEPDILPLFDLPSKKPVKPSDAEISVNPRSRSARLRYAIRTEHPANNAEVLG